MDVQILHLIDGAKEAKGLTVIIDVFRAFTVDRKIFRRCFQVLHALILVYLHVLFQEACQIPGIVQRCLDLVHYAERSRTHLHDREVQRNGYERLFAARESVEMNYDFAGKEFGQKVKKSVLFITENDGPYLIHCKEGKDRNHHEGYNGLYLQQVS